MKLPVPIFIGVIPATHPSSMKCCLRMSRDPGLNAAPFLWNKALAWISVAFYPSDLQLVGDPGS
jgi:hypothetical protein